MPTESPADRYCRLYWARIESEARDMCGMPMHQREMHHAHEAMLIEWKRKQERTDTE